MYKQILTAAILFVGINTSFSQIVVNDTLEENQLNVGLIVAGSTEEDLFFAISPDGRPQYGRHLQWNLNDETANEARFYYAKKGDYDRDDLLEISEEIEFSGTTSYPPNETPNINMDNLFVKLSTSWNFASDNMNIAIVSIHNHTNDVIESGDVKLRIPTSLPSEIEEVKIYNEWGTSPTIDDGGSETVLTILISELMPKEIRHFYAYIDVDRIPGKGKRKEHILIAEFMGESSELSTNLINPPHDPNALYLLNAHDNTMYIEDCALFLGQPELEYQCNIGQPFWFIGDPDKVCPPHYPGCWVQNYTLNYPYCDNGAEDLEYRIQCLNDGEGVARDIEKIVSFKAISFTSPFYSESFHQTTSTHDATGTFLYPKASFYFDEINLPGLSDPDYVRTYNECSAYVSFKVRKKCKYQNEIIAIGKIIFLDSNEDPVEPVITNKVMTILNKNPDYPTSQSCIPCDDKIEKQHQIGNTSSQLNIRQKLNLVTIIPDAGWVEQSAQVYFYDLIGRVQMKYEVGDLYGNTPMLLSTEQLSTGIYIVSIVQGNRKTSHKIYIP